MDEVRAKKRLVEITIAKSPLDYIMGKNQKEGEELREWISKSVADKLKKGKAETMWPKGGTWDSQDIEEIEKWLNVKKEEGTGNIKLKRQLRASMMGKWRKYRDMWRIEVGRLMRETVEATGVEKLAEKKASLNPPPSMGQKIPSTPPPYNEKLTMTSSQHIAQKRNRKASRDISGYFRGRRNHSEDSGRNA